MACRAGQILGTLLRFPLHYCSLLVPLSLHTYYVTVPTRSFYCTRLHCISLVKYCHATKWDGSQNIKYPSLASFPTPLSSPVLNSHFPVRTVIFTDQVQSLVSSPLSHLIPTQPPVLFCPVPRHPLLQDLGMSITVYSDFYCEITFIRKDPAVLHETLSKPALLIESYLLADTDLCHQTPQNKPRLQRSQQSCRLWHPWCPQSILKTDSCVCQIRSARKKARIF